MNATPGATLDATVFVSCIHGFTSRSEAMAPADVAAWCNRFFGAITEAVLGEDGVPVKYMGDGCLAYFAGERHQSRALLAAVEARDRVSDPLVIGLADGPVHLAAIGHPSYARPDILGAAVNRAFRVHGWAAKGAASRIAIATDALETPGAFRVGRVQDVELKGFQENARVSEIVGLTLTD